MPICNNCGNRFPNRIIRDGEMVSLSGRKFCLECSPLGGKNTRSYIVKLQDGEAFCARCQQVKGKNEFYSRKGNGKPLSYCIQCQSELKSLKFQENLERLIQDRGCACQDCGVSYPACVYEFYLEGKVYNLGKAKGMSFEKLAAGLRDHAMLCRNCSALRDWITDQPSVNRTR